MELGGNAPFIVFDDADIDAAIEGAMIAKMRNMGEACTAANRFYVQEKAHDEFAAKLTGKMAALKMGNGLRGRRARAAGKSGRPRQGREPGRGRGEEGSQGAYRRQGDAGARIFLSGHRACQRAGFGGHAQRGNLRAGRCDPDVQIGGRSHPPRERHQYGLVAYLYTKDLTRGMRVSEQLDFGMVGLNRGLVSDPAAPFGGMKQSGIGREGAHEEMMEFLETQYISVSW
jgi:succinate-semialdehyde dehydrogenase/glutarate-semialdehyde dehydrogenase